jgi:hypothetical protein
MIPLSLYFRRHIWLIVSFGVVHTAAILWFVGAEFLSTILGWGLAVYWTCALLVESLAFGSERWLKERQVTRSFYRYSLGMLAIVFIFQLLFSSPVVVQQFLTPSFWESFKQSVIEDYFGGGYGNYFAHSFLLVMHWAFLLLSLSAVRRLFRRNGSNQVQTSKSHRVFLILIAMVSSLPATGLVGESIRLYKEAMFESEPWYVRVLPLQIENGLFLLGFLLVLSGQLWTYAAWVPKSSTSKVLQALLLTVAIWLIPFIYGFARFGVTASLIRDMGDIYAVITLGFPFLLWGVHSILARSTGRSPDETGNR